MKKKTFIVQLLDSKKPNRKSFTQVEDALFYSNDTDASLVFIPHEDTFDFQSAKVVMFNRGDESLVERDMEVTTEDGRKVASYEMPAEIISHWGDWTAQPVFISAGEIYSGSIVPFSVIRYLMDNRPPTLRDVIKVDELYSQLVTVMDEISGKDVISAPEIILARDGFDTLGERLDDTTAQLAHKVGYGVKAEPEDLSATTLGLLTGEGGPIELMSVPQNFSVDSQKINPENRPDLLIRETVTEGYFLNYGTPTANNNLGYSDYIEVLPNEDYVAYFGSVDGQLLTLPGSFYDENMNRTGDIPSPTSAIQTITIPSNVRFARINLRLSMIDEWLFRPVESQKGPIDWLEVKTENYKDESITKEKLSDEVLGLFEAPNTIIVPDNPTQWVGKKANFIGDSITYGHGLDDINNERFTSLIAEELSMTCRNYGASGTKIARFATETNSFTQRYSSMNNDADIIFVFGGTNDYGHTEANATGTVPFGNFEDRTEKTFYGALHVLYRGLIEKYPGKKIIVITPLHRKAPSGKTGDDYVINEDTGKNLKDYVTAIREVAEYYGLKVLDLYKDLNMNPNLEVIKTAYAPDGLHPNSEGHKKIADEIISFMRRL